MAAFPAAWVELEIQGQYTYFLSYVRSWKERNEGNKYTVPEFLHFRVVPSTVLRRAFTLSGVAGVH